MKPETIIEWIGAVLVLGAFILITSQVWAPTDWRFLSANIVGSACIAYGAYSKKDFPPVLLNVIWLLIAVLGLLKVL